MIEKHQKHKHINTKDQMIGKSITQRSKISDTAKAAKELSNRKAAGKTNKPCKILYKKQNDCK